MVSPNAADTILEQTSLMRMLNIARYVAERSSSVFKIKIRKEGPSGSSFFVPYYRCKINISNSKGEIYDKTGINARYSHARGH